MKIVWKDHWTQSTEWLEEYKVEVIPQVTTVGWLIQETEDVVVLTPNIDLIADPPAFKGLTGILKSAIISQTEIV